MPTMPIAPSAAPEVRGAPRHGYEPTLLALVATLQLGQLSRAIGSEAQWVVRGATAGTLQVASAGRDCTLADEAAHYITAAKLPRRLVRYDVS